MKISVSESGVVQLDDLIAAVVKTTKLTPSKAKQKLLTVRAAPGPCGEKGQVMPLRNSKTLKLDEMGTIFLPREIVSALKEHFDIELEILPHGSGPDLWTLENAAAEVGKRLDWHRGSIETLQEQMCSAADEGALVVRDPTTDLPCRPEAACTYYHLVRTQDVDEWLASTGVEYRLGAALGAVPLSVPKQRGAAHAANILVAIADLRLRVMGLKRGDKKLIRARLGRKMTPAVFDKTWQRLRSENRIAGP
jgi:hypothetical protein